MFCEYWAHMRHICFCIFSLYSIEKRPKTSPSSSRTKLNVDETESDSGFLSSAQNAKKRRRTRYVKDRQSAVDTTSIRISARSGKATNYNEDEQYLGMLSEFEDDIVPSNSKQSLDPLESEFFPDLKLQSCRSQHRLFQSNRRR
ncbi:hypothetical protein BY996DRAFT_7140970 [Phakopsora pachyrhizi]|nr:hypothetical protein BY996DRAFT_7140970 [Phakopsora pachyrhizi]